MISLCLCIFYLHFPSVKLREKTLVARVKAFNSEAAPNIKDHHYLRPIPQTFLYAIYDENGKPLTADKKKALQNSGY